MANRNACWVESNPLWNDEMINLIPFTFPAKCDLIVILKFYVLQICVYIISKSVNKREKYDLEFMMTFLLEKQGRLFTCRSFTQTFFFFNFVCVVRNICWIWAYFRLSLRSHTNITDKRKEIHYKQANICELYSCFLWCCCLCFEFTTNYILRINSSGNICGMLSGFWEQQKYTSKYISFLGTHYFHIYLPTLACPYTRKFSHI